MSQANENDCSGDLVPPSSVDSQQGAVVEQRLGAAEVCPDCKGRGFVMMKAYVGYASADCERCKGQTGGTAEADRRGASDRASC